MQNLLSQVLRPKLGVIRHQSLHMSMWMAILAAKNWKWILEFLTQECIVIFCNRQHLVIKPRLTGKSFGTCTSALCSTSINCYQFLYFVNYRLNTDLFRMQGCYVWVLGSQDTLVLVWDNSHTFAILVLI